MSQTHSSHSTANLSSIVLTVRTDLIFSARQYGSEMMHVIEDDVRGQFFRIGAAEYTFLSFLDGRNTFADALGRTASVLGDETLKEDQAASFCRWLVETGVAHTQQSSSVARLTALADADRRAGVRQFNPMFIRFPLFCPDKLAQGGAVVLGWLFSVPVVLLWLLFVGSACFLVASHWDEIGSMADSVVSADNWMWLLGTWGLLKLLHESAHAVACRRFGGAVREGGILLLLLAPVPYVDVTSAWRFSSRWPRVMTDAAGMYAELFVFAVATWLWVDCEPGFTRQMLLNVMLTSSVLTIAVNANPLMRFDGYFILCDAFDLPNLAGQGRVWVSGAAKRIFFGLRPSAAKWPETRLWIVATYGLLAFGWRLTVSFGMIMAADAMFFGAGVVVALLATVLWGVLPLVGLIKLFFAPSVSGRQRLRFCVLSGLMAGLAVTIWFAPWYERREAAMVVDYYPVVPLRTASAGFVTDVYVTCGQRVTVGTPILSLSNPAQGLERHSLQQQLHQSLARVQVLRDTRALSTVSAETARAQALQKRVDQLIARSGELTVLASSDGVIVSADLESLQGQFLPAGTEVCQIGAGESKQVLAMVSQKQLPEFRLRQGASVDVLIDGRAESTVTGQLGAAEPRGRTQLLHPAFAAINGGPLEVRMLAGGTDNEMSGMELTEPHFVTPVEVPQSERRKLLPGQTGQVVFRTHAGRVGEVLRESVIDWWVARQQALQTQWQ
ncbi:MAG: HlyD family efflux transporter periplasmic adaptor subunit [Planctomycetaceae bacterium]|nr:HlyD family efflux transporter periplasmic adaptor subunit [Planctomycetaceae bacterium]